MTTTITDALRNKSIDDNQHLRLLCYHQGFREKRTEQYPAQSKTMLSFSTCEVKDLIVNAGDKCPTKGTREQFQIGTVRNNMK